jgi:hypothetical protein
MRVRATTWQTIAHAWLALLACALAMTGAMSAHAAWRAIAAERRALAAPLPEAQPTGYEADAHFPGAALLYAEDAPKPSDAAPAQGVTGTAPLPALPVPTVLADAIVAANTGIVAARPFPLVGSATDRARAAECLTAAIYYEAASEPDAGQQAVAQVVLNRVRHPAFPATVCGVVYQGSERAGCQFSFACDGAMARVPSRGGWVRAARVAGAALAGRVFAPVGLATHYHTYAVTPAWNRALVMTDVVGAHFFHRWKGYWGTAAAFGQRYHGGEPLPGPHMPIAAPPVAIATVAPAMPAPITAAATVQPAYRDSGTPRAAPAPVDNLPPASQVLDRWKDSGKPLL